MNLCDSLYLRACSNLAAFQYNFIRIFILIFRGCNIHHQDESCDYLRVPMMSKNGKHNIKRYGKSLNDDINIL